MRKIQILGVGCPKCRVLAQNVEAGAKGMGIEYTVEKVTDVKEMMKLGAIMTPALVIDGQVRAVGKVLSPEQIKTMLS